MQPTRRRGGRRQPSEHNPKAGHASKSDSTFRFADGTCIAQAQAQGVRMLFVVTRMPCVDGIVTAAALVGDKPMKLIRQRQVRRDDICVHEVMGKLSDLDVVPLEDLERATGADAAATLAQFGRPHLLVVERATSVAPARIRGLISHAQIERQPGFPLPMTEIASTFAEIEQALA